MLGAAWMVGALCAIREQRGIEESDWDYIVGTSAGSLIGALMGAGVTASQMRDHQLGLPVENGLLAGYRWDYDAAVGKSRPGVPRFGPGSIRLMRESVGRLRAMPPTAVLSAFLPEGRGSLDRVRHLVEAVVPPGEWAPHPGLWVVAMDYERGDRVAFGSPGAPPASLAEAVMASCAIPAWYSPVTINGRRYVDGGACSSTSADLLAGLGLDEIYVVAPMVSFSHDTPQEMLTRLERRWRVQVTKRCLSEATKVHDEGTAVTVLGPGAADLEVMGSNLMEAGRREAVLRTSLRTSVEALSAPSQAHSPVRQPSTESMKI
jgi:NTE family protein